MTKGKMFTYRVLSLAEFIDQYESCMPKATLFELTLPWLVATQDFMLPVNSEVIVHCLFEEKHGQALVAWPLVHNTFVNLILVRSLVFIHRLQSQYFL